MRKKFEKKLKIWKDVSKLEIDLDSQNIFFSRSNSIFLEKFWNDWLDELFVVNIVCDPVKRLLSDFTHVTDDHGNSSVINSQPFVKSRD